MNKYAYAILLLIVSIFVAGAVFLAYSLYDYVANQEDTALFVVAKTELRFTETSCEQSGQATVCYEIPHSIYKVTVQDGRVMNVTSLEVYNALAEDGWFNVRLCGRAFPTICGVFGRSKR